MAIQTLTLNVNAQPSAEDRAFLYLSQNENGRDIRFRVLGDDLPSGCTATLSGVKPDGNVWSKAGTVTNNFVVVEEDIQMTAVAGRWDAQLDIVNGSKNIVTALIRITVEAAAVEAGAVPSDTQLEGYVEQCKQYAETAKNEAYGSPLTAATAAAMTDQSRVYVYTGSETGYTAGHWYYHNGSAWTDGGVYNAVAVDTDTTLSVSGKAADAKKTGDEISQIKEDFNDIAPAIIETVSGAVASFTDGADGLPMDISVDSASASAVITKTGKNLSAPLASGSNTTKGLTFTFDGNGKITVTGTTEETNVDTPNKYFGGSNVIPIKFVGGRTYTITIDGTCEVSNNEVRIRLFDADNTSIWTANSGTGIWSITPESDFVANRIAIRFARSGNTVNIDGYIQIEEGDTATEYEAFDGQAVTATLVNGVVQEKLTSKKGINHVWSDADVTVSYRADTKLYIDKKLGV